VVVDTNALDGGPQTWTTAPTVDAHLSRRSSIVRSPWMGALAMARTFI
jgi:hypothetical protein